MIVNTERMLLQLFLKSSTGISNYIMLKN